MPADRIARSPKHEKQQMSLRLVQRESRVACTGQGRHQIRWPTCNQLEQLQKVKGLNMQVAHVRAQTRSSGYHVFPVCILVQHDIAATMLHSGCSVPSSNPLAGQRRCCR